MHLSCKDGWEEESNQRRAIRPLCGGPCSEPAASLGGCCSPEALGPILLAGAGGSPTARAGCAAGGFAGGVESGETHAGVLVLACLAARSGSTGLALQLGCDPVGVCTELLRGAGWLPPLASGGSLLPSPQAPEQPWGQSAWKRPAGDAGSLSASLVPAFTAVLDPSPGSASPGGNGDSVHGCGRAAGALLLREMCPQHPPPRWVLALAAALALGSIAAP